MDRTATLDSLVRQKSNLIVKIHYLHICLSTYQICYSLLHSPKKTEGAIKYSKNNKGTCSTMWTQMNKQPKLCGITISAQKVIYLGKKPKRKTQEEATNWMRLMGSHLLRDLLPAQASRDHVTYLAMWSKCHYVTQTLDLHVWLFSTIFTAFPESAACPTAERALT